MQNFNLRKEDSILFVIDFQAKLVPIMKDSEFTIENCKKLIKACNLLDIPSIATEQYPKGVGHTVDELKDEFIKTPVCEKLSFTAFTDETQKLLLQSNKKQIIITGIETHICVFQTVRDLIEKNYQVFIASDAVSSRTEANYLNGISLMKSMGAIITNTESIIFDLLKRSDNPNFKELSKLIK